MGASRRDRPHSVTRGALITDEEFAGMFRAFHESAFRLETREHYAMTYEREGFRRFLEGHPLTPTALPWWKEWLDEMRDLTREGKHIARVRVLSDPPSDYQRWELWATPWHADAGEQISYLSREAALAFGIPLDDDWWLFDGERLVIMKFTSRGEVDHKTLITDPGIVARYCEWRDLAVSHAATAGAFAAA
jgi:hypothetical protein